MQEEYLEWRVVHHDGRLVRVELTCELPDRAAELAGREPQATLERIARSAREAIVDPVEVFGPRPIDGSDPAGLRAAFADAMLATDGTSPYNDGRRAIHCMIQPTNTTQALVALLRAAGTRRYVEDRGARRSPSAVELAATVGASAQLGRSSDPVSSSGSLGWRSSDGLSRSTARLRSPSWAVSGRGCGRRTDARCQPSG